MPNTTEPLLLITDGVTNVYLMNNTLVTPAQKLSMPYRLSYDTWSPKVAQRNKSPFGLPYMSVMEEMTIDIKGVTPDDAMLKLQTLNTLLDQGERWFNNEIVNPVFIRYQPKGSAKTTYMSDVIIGRGYGDQSDLVDLPSNFELVGSYYWIRGIRVRFWRRDGVWLCESEAQNVGTSYVAQPGPITVTWSDFATVLSPIDIRLGTSPVGSSGHVCSGFVAVVHDSRYIGAIAGTAGTAATGTPTADASKFPTNANVNRYTLATSNADFFDISATPVNECEYFAVYAKVRNNSTTIDAYIQANTVALIQPEVKIAAAATPLPQAVFLGIFPTRGRVPQSFGVGGAIQIIMRAASGSITFDIDELMIVCINRSTNIIAINSVPQLPITALNGMSFLHRLLNEPQGEFATGLPPTNDVLQSYTGSIYCFTGASGTVKQTSVGYFLTDTTFWNVVNSANSAKSTIDLQATRAKAYLVPE